MRKTREEVVYEKGICVSGERLGGLGVWGVVCDWHHSPGELGDSATKPVCRPDSVVDRRNLLVTFRLLDFLLPGHQLEALRQSSFSSA